MKKIQFISVISLMVLLSSCAAKIPLSNDFYSSKKVGVLVDVDSIGMARSGSQGLLDIVVTPGNKFKEPLKSIEEEVNPKEPLETAISTILKDRQKPYEIIVKTIKIDNLPKFQKPKSNKKYSNIDFRSFGVEYKDLDEILYVKVRYGILVSYYGFIELDKQGYANIETKVVTLSDNSLLQQDNIVKSSNIKGKWKDGADYENLKRSIKDAVDQVIFEFTAKFNR